MTSTPPGPEHPSEPRQNASFEESLAEVGDIVARLESGSLGLSESIAAYERGVALLRRLHQELGAVEERVRVLVRIDDQGRPTLESLPAAADLPASGRKPSTRSAARTRRPDTLPGMDGAFEEA